MAWYYDPDLDKPGLNSGTPWDEDSDRDLRWEAEHGQPVDEIARFLCRSRDEIRLRAAELGITIPTQHADT